MKLYKVIRNGRVGVLYSPGFGAGWYTWNLNHPQCVFDPDIIDLVENKADYSKIEELAESKYGEDFYAGGAHKLRVAWLEEGTQFRIHEYDGSERIEELGRVDWLVA